MCTRRRIISRSSTRARVLHVVAMILAASHSAVITQATAAGASAGGSGFGSDATADLLLFHDGDGVSNATNATNSTAPSAAPSVSSMPSASPAPTIGANATASNAPSHAPSHSPAPTHPVLPNASAVPSAAPSAHPSAAPSSPPTANTDHGNAGHKIGRAIGWTVLTLLTALLFGACMSNHRRILFALRELWYRIRQVDYRLALTNAASKTREFCSGVYHRVRFGRWSFRGLGGRESYGYEASVPLNEIVFDPHDSGDPTELLLSRE